MKIFFFFDKVCHIYNLGLLLMKMKIFFGTPYLQPWTLVEKFVHYAPSRYSIKNTNKYNISRPNPFRPDFSYLSKQICKVVSARRPFFRSCGNGELLQSGQRRHPLLPTWFGPQYREAAYEPAGLLRPPRGDASFQSIHGSIQACGSQTDWRTMRLRKPIIPVQTEGRWDCANRSYQFSRVSSE